MIAIINLPWLCILRQLERRFGTPKEGPIFRDSNKPLHREVIGRLPIMLINVLAITFFRYDDLETISIFLFLWAIVSLVINIDLRPGLSKWFEAACSLHFNRRYVVVLSLLVLCAFGSILILGVAGERSYVAGRLVQVNDGTTVTKAIVVKSVIEVNRDGTTFFEISAYNDPGVVYRVAENPDHNMKLKAMIGGNNSYDRKSLLELQWPDTQTASVTPGGKEVRKTGVKPTEILVSRVVEIRPNKQS